MIITSDDLKPLVSCSVISHGNEAMLLLTLGKGKQ